MKTGRDLVADMDSTPVATGDAVFWWLGQHAFTVKTAAGVLYFDPYLSPLSSRQVAPLLRPGELSNATMVFGSHDHADHIDRPALPAIAEASRHARFVMPKIVAAQLGFARERVIGLDAEEVWEADDIRVTAIAAAHEHFDRDPTTGHPYLGYIVRAGNVTLYHSGDTVRYEGLETRLRRQPIDIAFLPINGRDARRLAAGCIGNMTYQEAVDLAGAVRPRLTVPGHYDMFASNSENPALFADYLRVKFRGLRFWIGPHGTAVRLSSIA